MEQVQRRTLDGLRTALVERQSALASSEALDPGLELQARSIVEETIIALRGGGEYAATSAVPNGDPDALQLHGRLSAMQDQDPAAALLAGEVLFDQALPILIEHIAQHAPETSSGEVARALHHAIWRRFPPGAIAYVDVLRNRLASAFGDARKRVARDLHDQLAHSIVTVIQQLELEPTRGQRTQEALAMLRRLLEDTQAFAFDMRQIVGSRPLAEAIAEYAESPDRLGLPIRFHQTGRSRALPALVAEEAYSIVIEAVRNAQAHAGTATRVEVDIVWTDDALRINIADDGKGFATGGRRGALGLTGASERAATIGGRIDLGTGKEQMGACVSLTVPFARMLDA